MKIRVSKVDWLDVFYPSFPAEIDGQEIEVSDDFVERFSKCQTEFEALQDEIDKAREISVAKA
jgi:hypothetical protein